MYTCIYIYIYTHICMHQSLREGEDEQGHSADQSPPTAARDRQQACNMIIIIIIIIISMLIIIISISISSSSSSSSSGSSSIISK